MAVVDQDNISSSSGTGAAISLTASSNTCTANITNIPGRNLIINGSQAIDQRNNGTEVTPVHAKCVTDRFKFDLSQASKVKAQQVADGPTGFTKSLKVTSLAATTPGASDYYLLQQHIEGLNSAQLGWGAAGAKTVTLSFWVKSSLTGTFAACIRNGAYDRANVQTYAISAADTWEKKTITFTGDTSGTWLTTTGKGLSVGWDFGGGTNFDAASTGSWLATNDFTTSSCTHLVATNAATWQITAVQLEASEYASEFDHKKYSDELKECRRYYYQAGVNDVNTSTEWIKLLLTRTGGLRNANVMFRETMRAAPTVTLTGQFDDGGATIVAGGIGIERCTFNQSSSSAAGDAPSVYYWTAAAEL
tara:strand:+ start:13855 stop:14940 length:1086 start_codon:yes stop_codon:yes gene_type:complete